MIKIGHVVARWRLQSTSVYNFQTKISEVPMVRFFRKYINKNVIEKGLPDGLDPRDPLTLFEIFSIEETLITSRLAKIEN